MGFYEIRMLHPDAPWVIASAGTSEVSETGINYRFTDSGPEFQLKNMDTGLFHPVNIAGNLGEETFEIKVGEV